MDKDNSKSLEMYTNIKKLLEVFGACKLNKTQKDFLLSQKKKLQRGKLSDEEKELYEYVVGIIEVDDTLPINLKSPNVHHKASFHGTIITDPDVIGMLPCDSRSVNARNGIPFTRKYDTRIPTKVITNTKFK